MKKPCAAGLDTARELGEHDVMSEGAEVLLDLRRCAADCGCDDWRNRDDAVQGAWHEATHKPLPEARPKPTPFKGTEPGPAAAPVRLALIPVLG